MEKINELIKEGYVKLLGESLQEACSTWLEAWTLVKEEVLQRNIKDIEEIDEVFTGYEKLKNWCQDLEMELENAGAENNIYWDERIRYCTEFCETLPETDQFILMNMELAVAESYFEKGDVIRGEELFQKISKDHSDSIWPNLKWGDCYWLANILQSNRDLLDLNKAEEVYTKALGKDENEQFIIEGRLEELKDTKEKIK